MQRFFVEHSAKFLFLRVECDYHIKTKSNTAYAKGQNDFHRAITGSNPRKETITEITETEIMESCKSRKQDIENRWLVHTTAAVCYKCWNQETRNGWKRFFWLPFSVSKILKCFVENNREKKKRKRRKNFSGREDWLQSTGKKMKNQKSLKKNPVSPKKRSGKNRLWKKRERDIWK